MEQKISGVSGNSVNRMLKQAAVRLITGVLLLFLFLLTQGSNMGIAAKDSDFVIEDGVLTAYNGTDIGVVVPNTVTQIGASVFSGRSDLVSVSLPDTVKVIGNSAFEECTALTFVNMPASLTTIGQRAFYSCEHLTEVVMPDTVTTVGKEAFKYCNSMASIKLSSKLKTIEPYTFQSCKSLIYVTVPSGVTTMKDHAFYECDNLLGVSLPDTVTTIESGAFEGCSRLLTMQIPGGVTQIPAYMFTAPDYYRDENLYALQIPASVTSIGKNAIPYCNDAYNTTHLQTVYFGGTETQWKNITTNDDITRQALAKADIIYNTSALPADDRISINVPSGIAKIGTKDINGTNGFTVVDGVLVSYTGSDSAVNVPDGVTYINPSVFEGNEKLTKVTLPTSLYGIGEGAFKSCINLTSVNFKGNTYYIGKEAFMYCSSLASVNLPEGMVVLEGEVFSHCTKLQSITLPQSLVVIGTAAFDASGLTQLTLPDQVLYFANAAVRECAALTSFTVPANVRVVGAGAFNHCDKLQEVIFPEDSKTKIIGWNTFTNCGKLSSIQLPKDLTKLDFNTFNQCEKITELEIPSGVKWIGSSAIRNSGIMKLTMSNGLEGIGNNAFANAYYLTLISIPVSVTELGDKVFENCTKLETVFIPGGVDKIGENLFKNCRSLKNIYYQGTQADWESKGGETALQNAPASSDGSKPKVTFQADPNMPALTVYIIRYDLQGGIQNGNNPDTYTPADANITLKEPYQSGCNFLGWISKGEWTEPKKEVTIQCAAGGDKHYTAVWEKIYKIKYTLNEGSLPSGSSNKQTYTENDADFTLVNPTRSGYAFLGWTGSNGTVPRKSVKVITSQGGDREYEANWARTHKIKLSLDGGKAPSGSYPSSYTEADPDLSIPDPVKEGTEFLGWYTKKSTDLKKNYVIPHGSTEDITLSAVWKGGSLDQDVYKITYNLDGGTAVGNPDSYSTNDPDIHINMPQKEEYIFAGWEVVGGYVTGTEWEPVIPHGSRGDLKFYAYYMKCDHEEKWMLPKKEPTCTEPGYEEGTCCACEKIRHPGTTIPALGHSYDNGVVTKQSTDTEAGVMTYTCTRCGYKKEEVIPAGTIIQGGGNGQGGSGQGSGSGQGGAGTVSGNAVGTVSANATGAGSGIAVQTGVPGKIGLTFKKGKGVYKITKRGKKPEVTYLRPCGKKKAGASIPATVKYKGVTYRVTAIGPKAFSKWKKKLKKVTIGKNVKKIGKEAFKGCKKLKTVVIKTTKLKKKNVGKNAFKGIHAKAKAKVPKKKRSAYRKFLNKAGLKVN